MLTNIDLSALLSSNNATRGAAEAALEAAQQSNAAGVASQLCTTLADANGDPTSRVLCAVLLRRRLPGMLPSLSEEWRNSVKSKLLEAISSPCDRSLRSKICDTVGRIGVELMSKESGLVNQANGRAVQAEAGWPELMGFIMHACQSGEPTAHEAALSVLSHMAPALVDPAGWAGVGAQLLQLLMAALGDGMAPTVSGAALEAIAALLTSAADQEGSADSAGERKKFKAVANDLQAALPPMLHVLELAVGASDPDRITDVLSHLSSVAAAQPRLFKAVLPVVVEGLGQLATGDMLEPDARISCAELLITLAEGAPKMCIKHNAFIPRLLGALLPMLLRLGGDLKEWAGGDRVRASGCTRALSTCR